MGRIWANGSGIPINATNLNGIETDLGRSVRPWAASTSYSAGQSAVDPTGTLVTATAAHTSGASFTPANWTYTHGIIPAGLTGGQDCTTAIQNAATAAQNSGVPLIIPAAANGSAYKMTTSLQLWAGARVIGLGGTIDFQTDHTATGIGLFIGNPSTGSGYSDVQVTGLKVISSNATGRNGAYGLISVFGCTNVLIQDCAVGNTSAGTGGESVGIFTLNSANVRIIRPVVQNTYADGIHITRGSTQVTVDHPIVIGAQDDAISVTSVKQDGAGPIYNPCQYVHIIQPTVRNSTILGDGVALYGTLDCTVVGGSVDTVPAHIFSVAQANYGGIYYSARNVISGLVGKNSGDSKQSFRVGNADRTVISGVEISQCTGGGQVLSSTRTKITGCGISSTSDQFGIYDDANSSRTLVSGCDLSANGAQSYNVYYGTAAGAENKLAGNVAMGTTSLTITAPPSAAGTVPGTNTSGLTVPTANTPTTATTGGTIPAGTYYLKVTAVNSKGETVGSNEVTVTTTGTTSTITVTWSAVVNAYLLQGAGSVQSANITA